MGNDRFGARPESTDPAGPSSGTRANRGILALLCAAGERLAAERQAPKDRMAEGGKGGKELPALVPQRALDRVAKRFPTSRK